MTDSCRTCKYRVRAPSMSVCRARDKRTTRQSPHDGVVYAVYCFRPTIDEMRAEGAPCGPDARLYRPSWWLKVWRWIVHEAQFSGPMDT
jgi:hypothetical protein